jgi:hypothetical protein
VRAKLAPFYSEVGRPSIAPELMIRMLIVGYCYVIRLDKWAPGGVPNIGPDRFRPLNDYVQPYRRDEPLLSIKLL